MALTSQTSSGGDTRLDLFWLVTANGRTDIARSLILCKRSAVDCTEEEAGGVITARVTYKVSPDSHLAAVRVGNNSRSALRLYYQSEGGEVVELNGDGADTRGNWMDVVVGGRAVNGTHLAASVSRNRELLVISVFYTAADGGLPTLVEFKNGWLARKSRLGRREERDEEKLTESAAQTIDSKPPSGWSSAASLAACYEPVPDIYRLYTVSARSGEIIEYWRIGPTGEWTRSGSSSAWGNA